MIQRYTPVDPDDTEENRDQQIPRTLTEYTQGVVTRVTYHAFLRSDDGSRYTDLNQVETASRDSLNGLITTAFTYDAEGRQLTQTISGGSHTLLILWEQFEERYQKELLKTGHRPSGGFIDSIGGAWALGESFGAGGTAIGGPVAGMVSDFIGVVIGGYLRADAGHY